MRGYFLAIGYQQAELEGVGGGSLCRFVCLSLHSLSRIPTAGDDASIRSPFRWVSRDGRGDLTWTTIEVVTSKLVFLRTYVSKLLFRFLLLLCYLHPVGLRRAPRPLGGREQLYYFVCKFILQLDYVSFFILYWCGLFWLRKHSTLISVCSPGLGLSQYYNVSCRMGG